MNNQEMMDVQSYMQNKFETDNLVLKRSVRQDLVEVVLGGEFIGTITKDEEEGEVSYNFSMVILDFDLAEAEG